VQCTSARETISDSHPSQAKPVGGCSLTEAPVIGGVFDGGRLLAGATNFGCLLANVMYE